ncbi:unnamed protein product [Linum trigynum]
MLALFLAWSTTKQEVKGAVEVVVVSTMAAAEGGGFGDVFVGIVVVAEGRGGDNDGGEAQGVMTEVVVEGCE